MQQQSSFLSFLPILLLSLIGGLLLMSVSRNKGKTRWYHYLSGFIPAYNFYYGFWLLSLTGIDIIQKVELTNEMLKRVLDRLPPTNWKCQCGQTNDSEVNSCPVCGLKKDFVLKKAQKE